jgi:hypothetical protein
MEATDVRLRGPKSSIPNEAIEVSAEWRDLLLLLGGAALQRSK